MVGTVKTDRPGTKFYQARTGIGRELAITKRRLRNTMNFHFWLTTDMPPLEIEVCLPSNIGHYEWHSS